MSARWATGWALTTPVEVRRVGNLTYVERCRLPVALVSRQVDQVGEVADQPGEVADQPGEVDPLSAAVAKLADTAQAQGRPLGRRTVARELGVTEYRAGQLLARTNRTGRGTP